MKRSIFITFTFLVFLLSCHNSQDSQKVFAQKTTTKSNLEKQDTVIYDTLVFEQNMAGKFLNDKYQESHKELPYYTQFIQADKKGELQMFMEDPDIYNNEVSIIYLGLLDDLNGINAYHILTNFTRLGVGGDIPTKGVSKIILINEAKTKIMIYRVDMPNELPQNIQNNQLYFEYNHAKIHLSISGGLPPLICIPEIGCYE